MKRRENGMTLLEILIVISVITIMSLVAYPSFMDALQDYKVRNCASELRMNILNLRSHAIRDSSRSYVIVFYPSAYVYGFDSDGDFIPDGFENAPPGSVSPSADYGGNISFGTDAANGPASSIACSGSTPANGFKGFGGTNPPRITFDSDGTLSATGCVFFKNDRGDNYLVSIETLTGKVDLWKWEGNNDWSKVY